MATLQKIRTRAGVLVAIIIGLALFSFILSDLFQSGSSLTRKSQLRLGSIDGESVQYPEFQKKVEELGEIYRSNTGKGQLNDEEWTQVREQTWQTMLNDIVMGKVYDKLGLGVPAEELFEMVQGKNPHPIVQQIFTNPNTGQFDRSAVVNFLKNLETGVTPEQKNYWLYLEKQIQSDKLQSKYNNLISKGLYVTGAEAQFSIEGKNKQVDIEFVSLNLNAIPDSSVKVTTKELNDYYQLHKDEYKSEKTRSIEYIVFHVAPSAADFSNAEKWINEIKSEFTATTDNVQFVNSNSDVAFDGTWYKKTDVPAVLSEWVASGAAVVNAVFGPYQENNSYKLAKVHASEMMPDSVQARHILLKANSAEEVAKVQLLADSLKNVIEKGGDFAALARRYSTDTGSASQGGDLGWFKRGMMVKPFEEAAFSNKINEVKIAASQFGIHVIQTTKLGKLTEQIQFAILERTVTPSTQTYGQVYARASQFASEYTTREAFNKGVEKLKLEKKIAMLREADRTIIGLETPRMLIRAAFNAKTGNVLRNTDGSPIFELGDNFVIAALSNATEEGFSSFESVKPRVELAVLKEKKSKILAERIKNAAQGKSDLKEIAYTLGAEVKTASNISFATTMIPDVGMEPALIGAAVSLEANALSAPVIGNNSVYLVKAIEVRNAGDTNVEAEKQRLQQNLAYRNNSYQTFETLKKSVRIEDRRSKFY